MEYLNDTSAYGVTFQVCNGVELVVYADATHAPKRTHRKSASGGRDVRPSNRFLGLRLSSSEAEYIALAEGFEEPLFLQHVRRFLLPRLGDPHIQVFEVNNGAM